MKKKLILLLSIILAMACLLSSCEEEKKVNVYKVSFKGIDGIATQEVLEGGKATQPALTNQEENSKPGFAFEGWTLDGDTYDFNATVTKDIVLVAQWGVECRITFDSNGGSEVEAVTVPYYTNVTKPVDPTRRGYTFEYWELEDEDGPHEYNFNGQPVYESFELVAKWKEKAISVEYVAETAKGSSIVATDAGECGGTVIIKDFNSSMSELTWAGHAFVGWSFNGKVYHADDIITVEPNANGSDTIMTLTAVWKDDYNVGEVGPSGGLIIFKANSVQTTKYTDKDGNEVEYQWQYIEAAPGPLGGGYCFGYWRENDTSDENKVIGADKKPLGFGRANTEKIVATLGSESYLTSSSTGTMDKQEINDAGEDAGTKTITNPKGVNAAKACDDYSVKNSGNMTYDDWYLPSLGDFEELFKIYSTFRVGRSVFVTGRYVTSTESPASDTSEETSATHCYVAIAVVNEYVFRQYKEYMEERSTSCSVWPVRYF